jgi:hypothetical protein
VDTAFKLRNANLGLPRTLRKDRNEQQPGHWSHAMIDEGGFWRARQFSFMVCARIVSAPGFS